MDLDFQPESSQSSHEPGQPYRAQSDPPVISHGQPANQPPTAASGAQASSMVSPQPAVPESPSNPIEEATGSSAPVPHVSSGSRKPLLVGLVIGLVVILIAVIGFSLLRRSSQSSTTPSSSKENATAFPSTSTGSLTATSPDKSSQATLPSTTTAAGRDAQRKKDLQTVSTLLASYFTDNQSYPIAAEVQKLNTPNSTVSALVPKYTASLPVDPLDPDFWYGYLSKDGATYELSARVENINDPEATLVGSKYLYFLKK